MEHEQKDATTEYIMDKAGHRNDYRNLCVCKRHENMK